MNAAQAFEVTASAAGLIEWLADEIEDVIGDSPDVDDFDLDVIKSRNVDIWQTAHAIRNAVNGSSTWEEAEKAVIGIRRRYDE